MDMKGTNMDTKQASIAEATPEELAASVIERARMITGFSDDAADEKTRADYEKELFRLALIPDSKDEPWDYEPDLKNEVALGFLSLEEGDVVVVGWWFLDIVPTLLREPTRPGVVVCCASQDAEVAERTKRALDIVVSRELPGCVGSIADVLDSCADGLVEHAADRQLKILDAVYGPSEGGYRDYRGWGPLTEYQEGSPMAASSEAGWVSAAMFEASEKSSAGVSAVIFWINYGRDPEDGEMESWEQTVVPVPFYDGTLFSVTQLPPEYGAWVFVWSGSQTETIAMFDLRGAAREDIAAARGADGLLALGPSALVSRGEIYVNGGFYTPTRYTAGYIEAEWATLGSMASRISRGTSLSRKALEFPTEVSANFALGLWHGKYCGYADTSSIKEGAPILLSGFPKHVAPEMIAAIPDGQERYVVDTGETVLLVPRNGKRPAVYIAPGPTLVSNNLFVVWLKDGWRDSEYMRRAITCGFVRDQIERAQKPLTRKALEGLVVPVPSEEVQESFVKSERNREAEIFKRRLELERLERADEFEYMCEHMSRADGTDDERQEG